MVRPRGWETGGVRLSFTRRGGGDANAWVPWRGSPVHQLRATSRWICPIDTAPTRCNGSPPPVAPLALAVDIDTSAACLFSPTDAFDTSDLSDAFDVSDLHGPAVPSASCASCDAERGKSGNRKGAGYAANARCSSHSSVAAGTTFLASSRACSYPYHASQHHPVT